MSAKGIVASVVESMGSDISVVNAARVTMGVTRKGELLDRDVGLVNFLARENHQTPFRHPHITFRCKAPIAIARQLGKHQVGFQWNEMSRRYKDGEVENFVPDIIFKRPDDLHDGAGGSFSEEQTSEIKKIFEEAYASSVKAYKDLLELKVAPEQARFVLSQGMITEWVWTGSLLAFSNLCKQRLSNHAQYESRVFAKQISEELSNLYPVAWSALSKSHPET